jgi:hypothetical protein
MKTKNGRKAANFISSRVTARNNPALGMMPELVRQDRNTEFASGVSDSPLEVGLMHPVTDFRVCAGMGTGIVGGK